MPWPVREYQRTCDECGNTWLVPRAVAKPKARSFGFNSPAVGPNGLAAGYDMADLARKTRSAMAAGQAAEDFVRCQVCGSEEYTQQPSRAAGGAA